MTSIHPSAVVADGAQLGEDVEIGPYSVVGRNVRLGDGVQLLSHVVLDGWTTLGAGCRVFPFACIGTQTQDLKFKGDRTSVEIGEKTTIREYVTVNSGTHEGEVTRVGAGCLLMACCHVAHACSVGKGVIMANSSALAGDVTVEDNAIVGGLTGVHQFVRIGRLCIVGGASKVNKDCPPYMMVDGNPAVVRGLNLIGLKRRGIDAGGQKSVKRAHHILFREGLSTRQAVAKIKAELDDSPEVDHLLDFVAASARGIAKP